MRTQPIQRRPQLLSSSTSITTSLTPTTSIMDPTISIKDEEIEDDLILISTKCPNIEQEEAEDDYILLSTSPPTPFISNVENGDSSTSNIDLPDRTRDHQTVTSASASKQDTVQCEACLTRAKAKRLRQQAYRTRRRAARQQRFANLEAQPLTKKCSEFRALMERNKRRQLERERLDSRWKMFEREMWGYWEGRLGEMEVERRMGRAV